MSDRLDEATRALRAQPVDHDRAADTRARLLAAAQRKRRSPRRRLVPWLVPLAAAFVATAALAGAGGRIAAWIAPSPPEPPAPSATVHATTRATSPRDVAPTAVPEPSAATATSAAPEAAAAPPLVTPPAAPATVPTIAPASVAKAAASEPRGATHEGTTANGRAAPSPPASAQPPSAQPPSATTQPEALAALAAPAAPAAPAASAPDPSDELYRAAHDLHFRGGSPAAAIVAWDRYLAAAPSGRFALEAQYNRAIALLRAGRKAEGLAALRPFASGAHGSYRKAEAQRLLDAAADGGT